MGKIHVLLKKEELNEQRLDQKIAVILDVLLATSTIAAVLEAGAEAVIPVLNAEEAKQKAMNFEKESFIVAGEYEGRTIAGFHPPYPTELKQKATGKIVILSTTNGTVAIRKATRAKQIYTVSLLNTAAVSKQISENCEKNTIIIVCSGSSGEFNVEDFYGAGCLIESLISQDGHHFELTDAAYAAHRFYQSYASLGEQLLKDSRIGKKLIEHGRDKELAYVAKKDLYSVVPFIKAGRIVSAND